MSRSNDASPAPNNERSFLAPTPGSEPRDRCFRCGKETAAGVGLCEEHNPRRIGGPSSTQMHATIFAGIALGVVGFFIIARLAVGTTGPFAVDIAAANLDQAGAVVLSYRVTNEGASEGVADCRVTRDGVPRPDDLAFRTEALPGGASRAFERLLAEPPEGAVAYDPERLSVVCT